MARSFIEDPLMACNFALIEVPVAGPLPLAFPFKTIRSALSNGNFVGMQNISIPEISLETKEIRQGNWPYLRQIPIGFSTGGNVTLSQAVLPLATDMLLWWLQAVNGIFAPRRNMMIVHTRLDRSLPTRILSCENCIPISYKPASDFDASASEVSIESLTFWTEKIDIVPVPLSDIIPDAF